MDRLRVACANCGHDYGDLTAGQRLELRDRDCPVCGAQTRTTHKPLQVTTQLEVGLDSRFIAPWDGLTLTLAAAIYAVIVTVVGVVIAMVGTGGTWLWWAGYALLALTLLVIGLLWPQPVIRAMRALVARARR